MQKVDNHRAHGRSAAPDFPDYHDTEKVGVIFHFYRQLMDRFFFYSFPIWWWFRRLFEKKLHDLENLFQSGFLSWRTILT